MTQYAFTDSIPESLRQKIISNNSEPMGKITRITEYSQGFVVEWEPIEEENMTDSERYGHAGMTDEQLEHRLTADLYELSNRLQTNEHTQAIGHLLWSFMSRIREAFRTAKYIQRL